MDLRGLGKFLFNAGALLLIVGTVLMVLGRIPGLGRMPGDIVIKKDHFTFYFPVVTCLVVSLLLTLFLRFFGPR
ncbi:MAG TPA: DUF2905 domain-containing protein [Elusimicrobiota bacterium]|nr:DUF2905 domain-containing protein [Elusimicrobiota bacterium]